jgi:hypothetical protein
MFGGSSRQARRPFNLSWERVRRAARFADMTGNLPADQGRAPQLYDEQLQRQQQEKLLIRGKAGAAASILFAGAGDPVRPPAETRTR